MRNYSILLLLSLLTFNNVTSQIVERDTPESWKTLAKGGRFMDRFKPMLPGKLTSNCWGAQAVLPRYIDNGVEDTTHTFWGGEIFRADDNKYHMFVNAWYENNPNGHMGWKNSFVLHVISDKMNGPFHIVSKAFDGFNPEHYNLKNGLHAVYAAQNWQPYIYTSNNLNGEWTKHQLALDYRDRDALKNKTNMTFTEREDGSVLMVSKNGEIYISKTGIDTFFKISDGSVYPNCKASFEDPVVWRDSTQYNLIVNDWDGRIAYYLRSKDGLNWVTDEGEAYIPQNLAIHQDGTKENWYKAERMKVYQDKYGRTVQANFAVCDTIKSEDKPNDRYSGKNICIPLNPGMLLEVLNNKTKSKKQIDILIKEEGNFNPQTDVDLSSLRFGNNIDVNRGKGNKVLKTAKSGNNLIITFDLSHYPLSENEFAPKILGKRKNGEMIFGYIRNPKVNYHTAILSAEKPKTNVNGQTTVKVTNFGIYPSKGAQLVIIQSGKEITKASISPLRPYENCKVLINAAKTIDTSKEYTIRIKGSNVSSNDFNIK